MDLLSGTSSEKTFGRPVLRGFLALGVLEAGDPSASGILFVPLQMVASR